MKIGVLSDSHDHLENVKKVSHIFMEEKVEKVVHCGDIIAPFVKRSLEELKEKGIEMVGVYGNNDGERAGIRKIMKDTIDIKGDFLEVEWNQTKIAIYHGTYSAILDSVIKSQKYDLVLTGHTHQIRIEKQGKTFVVNPGETCGYLTGKATCAIIEWSSLPLQEKNVKIIEI